MRKITVMTEFNTVNEFIFSETLFHPYIIDCNNIFLFMSFVCFMKQFKNTSHMFIVQSYQEQNELTNKLHYYNKR